MNIKAYIVNAFTENGNYSGNAAAVVLDQPKLSSEQRQDIARKIGVSETVFMDAQQKGKAEFKAEFYTPNRQIENCGHATLAAFSLVNEFTGKSWFVRNEKFWIAADRNRDHHTLAHSA